MNTSIFYDKILNKVGIKETEENYDYIKYGLEILMINLSKLAIIYGIALITKQIIPTLIVHLSYLLLRRYSFGLHARSSTVCTIYSIFLFNVIPYFVQQINLTLPPTIFVSCFIFICILLYAPADTENNPLIGSVHRKKLRIKSVICCILLLAIMLFIPDPQIKILILLGGLYQAISILPVTYKFLKRRYNNYEYFN